MKKIVKKKSSNKESENLIKLLWEYRILKYIPRASLQYLKGPAKENVAEHSFYTTIIGWLLAKLEGADEDKVIKICLIHDLAEARGGEKNLMNKFYSEPADEPKIFKEISKQYQLEEFSFDKLFQEFFKEETLEARVAKDADILAGMILEKECLDLGNEKASKWLAVSLKRLKGKKAQELGEKLVEADADSWWLEVAKKYIFKTKFF